MIRESDYYIWLRDLVCRSRFGYDKLLTLLDNTEYVWIFSMDENRSYGGMNLRGQFSEETSTNEDDIRVGPCSVLEMLIGVADKMDSQLDFGLDRCFWILIDNLGLGEFNDRRFNEYKVKSIVNTWLNHDYTSDGVGSIFPLKHYQGDCRNLDIRAQMNAWINENYPETDDWLN